MKKKLMRNTRWHQLGSVKDELARTPHVAFVVTSHYRLQITFLLSQAKHFSKVVRWDALYIFRGQNKEPHPFYVKSNWMPPVQPSIALESFMENVKAQLAEITVTKPKNNEVTALKELKTNSTLNLKKADKGTTTITTNDTEKIEEAKVQLDNRVHFKPLRRPIVKNTQVRVKENSF